MAGCKVSNEFLCRHSLFGGLSEEDLVWVRPFLTDEYFKKGDHLLTQGEPNNKVFFVVEGNVSIEKHMDQDIAEERQLAIMEPGDSFGEMELIDIQPCAASAIALSDTHVITLTNGDLYKLSKEHLKTYTMIIMNLAREISRRLRTTDEKLVLELYSKVLNS